MHIRKKIALFRHFFWGRDIFISYNHIGAERYAESLDKILNSKKSMFHPFFAGREPSPDQQSIEDWLARALRRSTALVLIGEPLAFKSRWVSWEIQTFRENQPKAPVFGISFGRTPDETDLAGPLQVFRDCLRVEEDPEALNSGQPSETVISHIERMLREHGLERRRRRVFYVIVSWLIALPILGFIAGVLVGKHLP
jgi:hypothetical protein